MAQRPSLDDLIALALEAGREIMAVRAAGFDTQTKLDGSPVTIADQRAEAVIERGLRRLAPDIPMIGEESVAAGTIPTFADRFFCVDPLDGTRAFAKGSEQFTVNIALIEDGAPVVGVVYAPATGELYAGEPGRALSGHCAPNTATLTGPLAPIAVQRDTPAQWRVIASDVSGREQRTTEFIAALGAVVKHRNSSIKFCRVAEGSSDLYPRFGDVSEWDAAAGHAVLTAAGGGVMNLDGGAIQYGLKPDNFLIHGFVAFGGEASEKAARAALKR